MVKSAIEYGDFLELANKLPDGCAELVATDPPFNIGFKYGSHYTDMLPRQAYIIWMERWLAVCCRILSATGSIYICQGDDYAAETKIALEQAGFHYRNWVVWYYTFGENQRKKFNRTHTHILYYTKSPDNFVWNGDAIRIPSARQLIYKDKRAKAGGKMPDDVWNVPRVCGTFKERLGYATQMPEAIMQRIIAVSSSPGQLVVDPFGGTFTSAAVAHKLGRQYWSCDISLNCVSIGRKRIAAISGD